MWMNAFEDEGDCRGVRHLEDNRPTPRQRDTITTADMFTRILDSHVEIGLEGIDRGHHKILYRGVKCIKCPLDYVLYQMLLTELRPDLIIEIGTNNGGSALYLADVLQLNGGGTVHTIDIANQIDARALAHPGIRFFGNGWEAYDRRLAEGFNKILVIEDSSHTYANTLGVMERFAPLVTPGSYMIVEDGIIDALGISDQYDGGPVRAIREFLAADSGFELDLGYSDFFGKNATFNTLGYLKRVKD